MAEREGFEPGRPCAAGPCFIPQVAKGNIAEWDGSRVRYPPHLTKQKARTMRAFCLAEREGFEPSIRCNPYDDLANRCLQPLGHLSVADRYARRSVAWQASG